MFFLLISISTCVQLALFYWCSTAKELTFGLNHLKAHHQSPKGAFSLASKVYQRKQSQEHVKDRRKERWKMAEGEGERDLVCLTIHHHPSVWKIWLRSSIVEYVDEEDRKNSSEGDRRKGWLAEWNEKGGGAADESSRKEARGVEDRWMKKEGK